MIDQLVRFSLKNKVASFILAGVIVVWGLYAFKHLTIEAFPDPTDTQVQVITLYPGQPTEEVERRVSIPLERALNGTPELFRLRSISLFGLSFVTLTFEDGVEAERARQRVLERLPDAELPDGILPSLGPLATPIGEVYRYTVSGSDPMALRTIQDWTIRPRIMQVPGVADVVSYGGLEYQIQVIPDPAKMASLGVGLDGIFDALEKASGNASGGYVERGSEAFVIRSLGIFNDLEDINAVRVAFNDGVPVRVKDVATVLEGYAPRQGVVTRDLNEDTVEGIILMRRGENPSRVLAALRDKIDDLNQRVLPDGVLIEPFYDRTELVNTTLKTVFTNLTEGALLVTLVMFLFTFSLRAALIVAAVIPLSLLTSFLYLHTKGMSANLLSMGAVDFGIIVDGAVIIVEHLFFRLSRNPPQDQHSASERIALAISEVARPTLFSLLIIIAAYIPIFALERVEGRMFGPMAHTVVSALVGALVVSFTLVPVLSLLSMSKRPISPRQSPLVTWSRKLYKPVLSFSLKNPVAIGILAAGAMASALVLMPRLGSEFLPELNEGSLYVTFTLPENISLTEGRKLTPKIKDLMRRTPEITGLLTQIGRPEDGTDPTLNNNFEVFVKLKPMKEWRPDKKTLDDLIAEIDVNLMEIPGIEYNFSQPIRDNVNENISGQFGQIAVKIYGEDLEILQELAEQVKNQILTVPGAADVGIVKSGEVPQIAVQPDRAALARYDLDLEDVQDFIETAMGGHVASEMWQGEKRFDVVVRLPQSTREDVGAIERVMLPLEDGALIPLSAVADVNMGVGRAAITRESARRYVGIRMNVRNRDMGSFVAEASAKTEAAVSLPPGYELAWGGEFENQERAMARLQLVVPLALAITFLLLFFAFGTISDALIVLIHVPFALVGGLVGLAIAKMPISVSAVVGFIALLGQAVLNGVLVISAIKARLRDGYSPNEAVFKGAFDRLRAVLMTALLASLGLLPAALSHAIGSETQRPLAVVVVTGSISAALLTLLVLPVTYLMFLKLRNARTTTMVASQDA
ncbi:MAG TPA: CusA/CzcA family heavy metal efflux RND transporter [Myxococcota bacterium]|nr:CusA/CzcA family heavy metal efflux RND transporter [Myxococcota bacterium]HRR73862.1 CusA/CzcA family heavy metal efflux RND transporter [Myxococcota bacterium]HRV17123.1 CusA/CzcA family heavy metal efflux RND transporter [Myxococcota bacterium]